MSSWKKTEQRLFACEQWQGHPDFIETYKESERPSGYAPIVDLTNDANAGILLGMLAQAGKFPALWREDYSLGGGSAALWFCGANFIDSPHVSPFMAEAVALALIEVRGGREHQTRI